MRLAFRFVLYAFALASSAPAFAVASASSSSSTAQPKYTTADTDIGTLLDNPITKAIIEKFIPGFTTNDQVEMARPMTLQAVQQYAPADVTNERLAAIDVEFAKLK